MKNIKTEKLVTILALILFGAAAGYFLGFDIGYERGMIRGDNTIKSFDECVSVGGRIGESYPRQCWTEDGKQFRETLPPEDVDNEDGCVKNSECAVGEYCSRSVGQCGGAGVCEVQPEACTLEYNPVCGCDGETYGNACGAASAGVSITYDGECE